MSNKNQLSCGCVPDKYECWNCRKANRKKIWAKMGEREKEYDRHFAPEQSAELDRLVEADLDERQCSCHINPPCSYCVDSGVEE